MGRPRQSLPLSPQPDGGRGHFHQFVVVDEGDAVLQAQPLGYPTEGQTRPKKRKPIDRVVRRERYRGG